MIERQEALDYHSQGRRGKIEVVPTKPCVTQRDLSLAYTPGVAWPCLEIEKNPDAAYEYTAKGNLVAVLSNGSAVLGLGNLGALAGKPVMEGKGVLFKQFADVDVFDIEVDTRDPEEIIRAAKPLAPTFGGINLEDIKAPECFEIQERLKEELDIPVFHDDQHGTAIISAAGLLNALELVDKKTEEVKLVVNGAGAAGIACAKLYERLGVRHENIIMCDTRGVIYKGREAGMNKYKEYFAADTPKRTLEEAMEGADVFVGVSVKGAVTKEMLRSMADNPIVFAMANPDPEITYEDALDARSDVIMATGRSDYPNQVNNVLGFPFIFRGALDVRASAINEEMKVAAARSLAALAKEDVPEYVCRAYSTDKITFGREYIIPKPVDARVLLWEATAVARAAIESGVSRLKVDNLDAWEESYREDLEKHLGHSQVIMRQLLNKAKLDPRRIVFPEGESPDVVSACKIILDEGIAKPVLIGDTRTIEGLLENHNLSTREVEIVDPLTFPKLDEYTDKLFTMRQRVGMLRNEARTLLRSNPGYLGAMLLHEKYVDGVVTGAHMHYPDALRPMLEVVRTRPDTTVASGVYMMIFKNNFKFFADTTVTIDPTAEQLAEIAIQTADMVKQLDIEPRLALLSFSNFGSVRHEKTLKVRRAVELVKERRPDLTVDGEMQVGTAVSEQALKEDFPFSALQSPANVLIFPDLQSGNIGYKLVSRLGGAVAIGPILVGMNQPVCVLERSAEVREIVNLTALTVIDAQTGRA